MFADLKRKSAPEEDPTTPHGVDRQKWTQDLKGGLQASIDKLQKRREEKDKQKQHKVME